MTPPQTLSKPRRLQATLTLANGSRAGRVVNLHCGFYLIGRDAECQVRPKSRSVSRRHCLIQHHEGQLRLVDLSSTSGTRLNGQKLRPRLWYPLADGDRLQCGKVAFAIAARELPHDGTAINESAASASTAWQADEIADWMTDFDEIETAERIQRIRGTDAGEADGEKDCDAETASAAKEAASEGSAPKPSARPASKPASPRSRPFGGLSLPSFAGLSLASDGAERNKLILASLLLVAALAWFFGAYVYFGEDDVYRQIKQLDG